MRRSARMRGSRHRRLLKREFFNSMLSATGSGESGRVGSDKIVRGVYNIQNRIRTHGGGGIARLHFFAFRFMLLRTKLHDTANSDFPPVRPASATHTWTLSTITPSSVPGPVDGPLPAAWRSPGAARRCPAKSVRPMLIKRRTAAIGVAV